MIWICQPRLFSPGGKQADDISFKWRRVAAVKDKRSSQTAAGPVSDDMYFSLSAVLLWYEHWRAVIKGAMPLPSRVRWWMKKRWGQTTGWESMLPVSFSALTLMVGWQNLIYTNPRRFSFKSPAHVVQWSNHLGTMCSRAWRSQWPKIDLSLGPGASAY